MNLAFNFMFLHSKFDADEIRGDRRERRAAHPRRVATDVGRPATTTTTASPTRWGGNDPRKTRAAMLMMLTLRGTPFLYYGDEIGMPDTDIPVDRVLDPVGMFHGPRVGRDGERTPMQWTGEPGAGFTRAGVEPWLPFGDVGRVQRRRAAPRPRLDALVHA